MPVYSAVRTALEDIVDSKGLTMFDTLRNRSIIFTDFFGDVLTPPFEFVDDIWESWFTGATGSFVASNNGEYEITTAALSDSSGVVGIGNRAYNVSKNVVVEARFASGSTSQYTWLLLFANNVNYICAGIQPGYRVFSLFSQNSGDESRVITSVPVDTVYHTHRIECSLTELRYYIDGELAASKTDNIPTTDMGAYFYVGGDTKNGTVDYMIIEQDR